MINHNMATTATTVEQAVQNFGYLDKAVSTFDPRHTLRVWRTLPTFRKQLDAESLGEIVARAWGSSEPAEFLFKRAEITRPKTVPERTSPPSAEVDAYVHLLCQVWLLHDGKIDACFDVSREAVKRLRGYNRRSLDYLAAKIWFYYGRVAELKGQLETVRPELMGALRTASLRRDNETQGVVITLLLRNLILCNQYAQAAQIVSKTTWPENVSNAVTARYCYYLSRINSIQLDYSTAFDQITAAIRKVPQTSAAVGFLQTAYKLSVLIELLMGDIPDRQIFTKPELQEPLRPYLDLTRAVRAGDVAHFGSVLAEVTPQLEADHNLSLARRLRQNVIKTGVRAISLAYSRISLKDICIKLRLDGEESAEYIVAKAIRDGVIDAELDHQRGYMQSREVTNVYSTREPQQTFHERIIFCMALHDDSVKSMRYVSNDHRDDLKDAQEAREREKELLTEIQEGTDLEDDDVEFDL